MRIIGIDLGTTNSTFSFWENGKQALFIPTHHPLFEASHLQGILGKYLLKMKVTNFKGERINIVHAYWRSMCFLVSNTVFVFSVWFNIFSKDRKQLHGKWSQSLVTKV